jgi:hypothetical protein
MAEQTSLLLNSGSRIENAVTDNANHVVASIEQMSTTLSAELRGIKEVYVNSYNAMENKVLTYLQSSIE